MVTSRLPYTLLGILLLILSLGFHSPIGIYNVLTNATANDFSIHISGWRIVFEPFMGPLLFYSRASQPFLEMIVLLVWIVLGVLVVSIIQRALLRWVMLIPVIFGLWVVLILVIIFLPLPSNTIVNQNQDTILVNMHSHSHFSHDGLISQKGLLEWHQHNGFDAFFLTEHNHHDKTLELIQLQRSGGIQQKPLVLCGQEFSGSNHLSLIGLSQSFRTRGLSDSTVIDSTHALNGAVIVAHWFEGERNSIQYYVDKNVDGFEIVNQKNPTYDPTIFNAITEACRSNRLVMVGSCDYHGYGSTSFTWTALKIPGWHEMNHDRKTQSIMDIFRQRDQDKIRVLIYRDRKINVNDKVFLSPILSFFDYVRGLNPLQTVTWIGWIFALAIFKNLRLLRGIRSWFRARPFRLAGILGLGSGLLTLSIGISFLTKAVGLRDYNDLYSEAGVLLIVAGAVFTLYAIILLASKKFSRS